MGTLLFLLGLIFSSIKQRIYLIPLMTTFPSYKLKSQSLLEFAEYLKL